MVRRFAGAAQVVLLLAWAAAALAAEASAGFQDVVERATFVFQGAVVREGATTLPLAPASPHTVVVKVGQVFSGPDSLRHFRGRAVTVRVLRPESAKAGTERVFFTRAWLLGEGAALIEVGEPEGVDTQGLTQRIEAAQGEAATARLYGRLTEATLVVVGQVVSVERVRPKAGGAISEHDPLWTEATLQVQAALKGKPPGERLRVWFPGAADVAWRTSPRFSQKQAGIWILQLGPDGYEAPVYTALDPLDFQTLDARAPIESLLAGGKR